MKENRIFKNKLNLIPIGIMFVILAILLVYMSLPLGQTGAGAMGGVADLRGLDLSSAIYQLSGQWQVARGALLTPETFPDDAPAVEIPERWAGSFDALNAHATYRLRIYTDDTRQLVLVIPEIYTAYEMWINGEYVRGAGVVADNRADASPEFETVIVSLKASGGAIEIVMQVCNYHFMRPMMCNLLLLGENDLVHSWFYRSRSLYIMALGALLVGAFYHIAVFIQRRKELVYLFYSLLSLICFWRYAIDVNGISDITGWFSANGGILDLKLFMVLFFLHGMAISGFSLYVFDKEWLTKRRLWALGYLAAGLALYVCTPWNSHLAPVIMLATMLPPVLLAIVRAAMSRKLREDRMMWLYFIALVAFPVVNILQKYFFDHLLFMTGMVADMFLLMAQALILSKQFVVFQEAEQSLEEKNAALDRLSSMKTEILQNLNHDLKTPLTVIATDVMNAMDMLEFGINEGQMRENLENAEREIMRMSRMVSNAVKNSSTNDSTRDMAPLSIPLLLREVEDTFHPLLERSGNTLVLDVPEALPQVRGNDDMLLHVLSNLVSNANRYTRNGKITISAGCSGSSKGGPNAGRGGQVGQGGQGGQGGPDPGRGGQGGQGGQDPGRGGQGGPNPVRGAGASAGFVTICVKDTGSGITPELLPHVFKRGVSDGGTGLGLSISKNSIEAHGGTIGIESKLGEGTMVWFSIPVCAN